MRGTSPKQYYLAALTLLLWAWLAYHGINTLKSYTFFTVSSGSMEPALATGAVIAVQDTRDALLAPGQVITYLKDDIYITHRIHDLGFDGQFYYITKGDANTKADPHVVRPQQVIGRVVIATPPYLSATFRLLRSRVGFAALLILVLYLLFHAVPNQRFPKYSKAP